MPTIDMATIISQTPYVQSVAGAQQSIPAAQQAATEQAVKQAFENQKHQVQKIEKTEALETVTRDKDRNKKRRYPGPEPGAEEERAKAESETNAAHVSPWAGNIIDVKI